jgi:hypothetical protein
VSQDVLWRCRAIRERPDRGLSRLTLGVLRISADTVGFRASLPYRLITPGQDWQARKGAVQAEVVNRWAVAGGSTRRPRLQLTRQDDNEQLILLTRDSVTVAAAAAVIDAWIQHGDPRLASPPDHASGSSRSRRRLVPAAILTVLVALLAGGFLIGFYASGSHRLIDGIVGVGVAAVGYWAITMVLMVVVHVRPTNHSHQPDR